MVRASFDIFMTVCLWAANLDLKSLVWKHFITGMQPLFLPILLAFSLSLPAVPLGLLGVKEVNISNGLRLKKRAHDHEWGACPQWIEDYVIFHRTASSRYEVIGGVHHDSKRPKLIMHDCDSHLLGACSGLGDRIRGLMETFKFAVYSNRVFLLRCVAI